MVKSASYHRHAISWIRLKLYPTSQKLTSNTKYIAKYSRASRKRLWEVVDYENLRPGQTESQVDASWKLGSSGDSVWPGLACTCVDLRWLALTLVEIKFARKSEQISTVWPPNPSERKLSDVHEPIISQWNTRLSALKCFFSYLRVLAKKLASPFGHPTQVSTQVQVASTCDHLPVRLTRALHHSGSKFCLLSML